MLSRDRRDISHVCSSSRYFVDISQSHQIQRLGCRQFNYIFYVDFEASTADVHAQNALKYLQVSH
jgi:hypothetical protein